MTARHTKRVIPHGPDDPRRLRMRDARVITDDAEVTPLIITLTTAALSKEAGGAREVTGSSPVTTPVGRRSIGNADAD